MDQYYSLCYLKRKDQANKFLDNFVYSCVNKLIFVNQLYLFSYGQFFSIYISYLN